MTSVTLNRHLALKLWSLITENPDNVSYWGYIIDECTMQCMGEAKDCTHWQLEPSDKSAWAFQTFHCPPPLPEEEIGADIVFAPFLDEAGVLQMKAFEKQENAWSEISILIDPNT